MINYLRRIRCICALWALSLVFLVESPSVLFIENEARIWTTQEINRVGILCIIRFVLLAVLFFSLGTLLYAKLRGSEIKLCPSEYKSMEKLKSGNFARLIAGLIIALLPLFSIAEPAINLFTKHDLDAELVESYWIWLFLAAALTLFIASFSILRFFVVRHSHFVEDSALSTSVRRHDKKLIVTAFAIIFLLFLSSILVMRNGSWFLQPYISTIPAVEHPQHNITYDSSTGVYSIETGESDFRILQLTDIHLGGSIVSVAKDRAALEAIYSLVEFSKPDLIIITGDSVFPLGIMSFSLNNYVPMIQLGSFMRNLGIPWAITFGNHDTEDIATNTEADISQVFEQFSFAKTHSLLYPDVQPPITGRSNQMLLLKNGDGSIRQVLFLIDSNDYQSKAVNDYDYIRDDQVGWYKDQLLSLATESGTMPKSLVFFHIPLVEYQKAYDLYTLISPKPVKNY